MSGGSVKASSCLHEWVVRVRDSRAWIACQVCDTHKPPSGSGMVIDIPVKFFSDYEVYFDFRRAFAYSGWLELTPQVEGSVVFLSPRAQGKEDGGIYKS